MASIKPCQLCGKDLTIATVHTIDIRDKGWRRVCGSCFQKRGTVRGKEDLQQ